MPTRYPEIFAALCDPFEPGEIKTKPGGGGRVLQYVTAATVDNRLDSVVGPENWWPTYGPLSDKSVTCGLSIRLPDGSVVTKWDCGGAANMTDEGDDDKSAYSDARKRAACVWGVGRYLRRDGVPTFVSASPSHGPASVEAEVPAPVVEADVIRRDIHNRPRGGFSPQTGAEFTGWLKKREREYPGLTNRLHAWAAKAQLPVRMLGWDLETSQRAYRAVQAAIAEIDRERQEGAPEGPPSHGPAPTQPNGAYPRKSNGKP